MDIQSKLSKLRVAMRQNGLDAWIITGSDPHGSESPPLCWRTREWISGFTGSAGFVVVTQDSAGLWTDFRYWIQADDELKGTEFILFKDGQADVQQITEWLVDQLGEGAVVGVDGRTVSHQTVCEWRQDFDFAGIKLETSQDLLANLWIDRGSLPPAHPVELHQTDTGETRIERMQRLRFWLEQWQADTWIGTALDSIAWLLNIRGDDILYTPVIIGYLVVGMDFACFFTDRLTSDVIENLQKDGVKVISGPEPLDVLFGRFLTGLDKDRRILFDAAILSEAVVKQLPDRVRLIHGPDPVQRMKAVKNQTELGHLKTAMKKDGAALVKFLFVLEQKLSNGESIGEIQAAEILQKCRASIPGYLGASFTSIAAVGANGVICHYQARDESQKNLTADQLLFLIDSGGQWTQGTTDITRTVALGPPPIECRQDYTRVLKAHLAFSRLQFPSGIRGDQIDAIVRSVLWKYGIDYGHGTGHGVGFRLSVHENPPRIGIKPSNIALEPGMVMSNEPSLYRDGRYGIRIENLLVCRKEQKTEFGEFYSFETLSLAPYDSQLIDISLLDLDELGWIDAYHQTVFERLESYLEPKEKEWLRTKTRRLSDSID